MHSLLRVPYQENPTSPFLTPGAAYLLQTSPLLALGALDDQGRPWTTVWGGEPGFARSIAPSVIGLNTLVDRLFDPVVGALVGGKDNGEVNLQQEGGRMVSGLAIDLAKRKRVKLFGRLVGSALDRINSDHEDENIGAGQVQLALKIEQSLGETSRRHEGEEGMNSSSRQAIARSTSTRSRLFLLCRNQLWYPILLDCLTKQLTY